MIYRATGPIHGGSSVESGFEPGTLRPQSLDLSTTPPLKHRNLKSLISVNNINHGRNRSVVGSKPIPLKICLVWGLLHVKSYIGGSSVLSLVWCGSLERGCQLRCRPRHLTAIQKYEVRLQIALVLVQNGTLI
ncbi:hypothetical protein AVEN_131648-1 [Araneus ventricosus]|uniref:Uncharacterized protein n=1 Tax=Araneus ventricosus TaxID=182803 RepID=A0A4Y2F0V6_ARAVE|nr:hypothetical protein AVEN_131648-1 [Araneus ventricosus]